MAADFILKEVKISPDSEAKANQKLRDAFRRKYRTNNPNYIDPKDDKSVFAKILRTKNSSNDILWCIKNGADLYVVSWTMKWTKQSWYNLIAHKFCFIFLVRRKQKVSNYLRCWLAMPQQHKNTFGALQEVENQRQIRRQKLSSLADQHLRQQLEEKWIWKYRWMHQAFVGCRLRS